MVDVTGFGLEIRLIASTSFPQGISITQLADDVDPFDLPSIQIGDTTMGVNGDMITWSTANPIQTSISVIAGSDDDRNLSILFEANRVSKGKPSVNDNLTLVGVYPDGRTVQLSEGKITNGMPSNGVGSNGRIKTKTYQMAFGNKVGL